MKFSINKSELQNALGIVLKGVSSRSTLPVLSGILIDAREDGLIFQTTDLDFSIQYKVAALVEEEGRTVVPGKLFNDIVKSLADAAVRVQQKENEVHLTCETSSFSVKTMNYEDFPAFPQVQANQKIHVPFPQFAHMVKSVARSVSRDESRIILTGVLVTVEDDKLRMVATDSYRLAMAEAEISADAVEVLDVAAQGEAGEAAEAGEEASAANTSADAAPASAPAPASAEFQAVISGSFLQEIAALPKTEENVTIALAENQILVTCENTIFVNRRIEGTYPNYKQLLPDSYTTRVQIDLAELTSSVRRVSLLTSTSSPLRFDMNMASQTVQIDATSADVGSAQEILKCSMEGEDMQIAFNSMYVLDGLGSIEGEQVYFDLQSPQRPGIFRTVEDNSFLYLIMPVKI